MSVEYARMVNDPGLAGVRAVLARLQAGASRWMRGSLEFFDPSLADPGAPAMPKVKAAMELALLSHCWSKIAPGDEGLHEVSTVVRRVWQRPEFPRLLAADPDHAQRYRLTYYALAPAGLAAGPREAELAALAASDYVKPTGKSPYLRLETRFYADLAGAGHEFESYQELYASSLLANRDWALPVTYEDAYNITHTIFYLSDFGFRDPDLGHDDIARSYCLVRELTDHYSSRDKWDITAELLLGQFCLGENPARTPQGQAAIRRLVAAQTPEGAIPGRSAARRALGSETPAEFFRMAYHTTLVTTLLSLIILSDLPES